MRKWIVTGLGTGFLPVAPGTWGSAAVAAIFLGVAFAAGGRRVCVTGSMVALALLASLACLLWGGHAESTFGRKDPSEVTVDEWAGQALTYVLLPVGGARQRLIVAAAGFVAFRIADIVKPPPAGRLQRLPAGAGILVDDLIAAVYANLLCQIIFRAWLKW